MEDDLKLLRVITYALEGIAHESKISAIEDVAYQLLLLERRIRVALRTTD